MRGEPGKFATKQNLGKDKHNTCWNILGADNANPNKYRYMHKNTTSVFSSIFKVVFPNSERWESFLGNCWIRSMSQRVNFFFYFFFHTLHPDCNFTSPHFSQTFPSTSPLPEIHSSFVTLQRRTGFPGISTNMAEQVTIKLDTNFHIKAGWGNPVGGKGSQEQVKE